MVDDVLQPSGPARPGWENIVPESFNENPPSTMELLANKQPCDHLEVYFLAFTRQVRDLSLVSAEDSARTCPAQWAFGHTGHTDRENNRVSSYAIDNKLTRHERRDLNAG